MPDGDRWTGPPRHFRRPREVMREGRKISTRMVFRGDVVLDGNPQPAAPVVPPAAEEKPETPPVKDEGDGEEEENHPPGGEDLPMEVARERGWELKMHPYRYIQLHPDGRNAPLARQVLGIGEGS